MSESDAHIQDADILKISRQEQHESKPLIRFACTLPSGRELHSEWLDQGKRREAVQAWLGAVRAQIVADEEESRLKSRRAALEARAARVQEMTDSQTSAPSAAIPASTVTAATPSMPVGPTSSLAPSAPSSDPAVFVRQAVAQADQTVAYWRAESAKAVAELAAAQAALQKWRTIALNLGVSTSEANSPNRAAAVEPSTERVAIQQSNSTGDVGTVPNAGPVCEV